MPWCGADMSVIIPVLSKKEKNPEFLAQALREDREAMLVLPVDLKNQSMGFAASDILSGEELMEEAKRKISFMRKKADYVIEWGEAFHVIDHLAKLRRAQKVVLVKQDHAAFKELVKKLGAETEYRTEIIEVPEPKEPKK